MKTIKRILLLLSIGILLFLLLIKIEFPVDNSHCGEKMDTVSYPPYDTN